jgi:hypothetical protein
LHGKIQCDGGGADATFGTRDDNQFFSHAGCLPGSTWRHNRAAGRRLPWRYTSERASVARATVHRGESELAHWIYRPSWEIRYGEFWRK